MKTMAILAFLVFAQNVFAQEPNEKYIEAGMNNLSSDHKGSKIQHKDVVSFVTLEELTYKGVIIPAYAFIQATVNFTENRILFNVEKITLHDKIHAIKLSIVGPDLKEGIPYTKGSKFWKFEEGYKGKFLIKE